MRNLKSLSIVWLAILLLSACSTENQEANEAINSENKQAELEVATINTLLDNIKPTLSERASKMDEFEFITFEVVKNLKTNEISLENFKEVRLFPISDNQRTTYVINCDNGGDGSDDWEEECHGVSSCGRLIKRCLDGGGCAEICQMKSGDGQAYASVELTYIPRNK